LELFRASQQWSTRPADERFSTLAEMRKACRAYADSAVTSTVSPTDIRVETVDGEVQLTGRSGRNARLTHWSFGQLARTVGAPAEYLRNLPATLAVQNLNYGLKERSGIESDDAPKSKLLFHQNGDLLLRAITGEGYTRIWNYEVVERLERLAVNGWRVPPARPALLEQPGTRPATEADVLEFGGVSGLSVKVGDLIAPAGLYASDHDMFAYLINETYRIKDGTEQGLSRGFFVENSEVGGGAFRVTTFLYRFTCGNHIVFGAQNVREISIRHVGNADDRAWAHLSVEIKKYADSSVSDIEAKIVNAKQYEIAATKDDVLDTLFNLRIGSRKMLTEAYDVAEANVDTDGSPRSAWGMCQAVTRLSQKTPFADKRAELDRAGSKILEIVF